MENIKIDKKEIKQRLQKILQGSLTPGGGVSSIAFWDLVDLVKEIAQIKDEE